MAVRLSGLRREVVGQELGLISPKGAVGGTLKELGVSTKALQVRGGSDKTPCFWFLPIVFGRV